MTNNERIKSPDYSELKPEIKFGLSVAQRIKEVVMPVYGIKQSDVPINKISGDFNYRVDQLAEEEIKKAFQKSWLDGKMYGYVTEDQGLVLPPDNKVELIFMIDPVDGSRPAQIGAENACITMVAVKGNKLEATFDDILFGIDHALKEDLVFLTEKGKGVYKIKNDQLVKAQSRTNISGNLKDASMVYETYSMSAEFTGRVIDPLLRELSFETRFPSGSYSALTIVRGQNDLHVDLRKRLRDDYPHLNIAYKPSSKSLFPMDIAAGWLMIKEMGGVVTDGYGNVLDNVKLWIFDQNGAWSKENEISWIAAPTPELYTKALEKIEEGFTQVG